MVENQEGRLSILLPCYNEGQGLYKAVDAIKKSVETLPIDVRIVLIDDGSRDDTWNVIGDICAKDNCVYGLRLSRNFGKEHAILAGLSEIESDSYLVMDSDLQHPPAVIPIFWEAFNKPGIDAVEGVKSDRGNEGILYKSGSFLFYKLLQYFSNMDLANSSDFKLFSKAFRDAVIECTDQSFFFRGACSWIGFQRTEVLFKVEDRFYGKSKFSFSLLINMIKNTILANTKALLKLALILAVVFTTFAIFLFVQTLYNYITGNALSGFTTVLLFLAVQSAFSFAVFGILGEYISRIYQEVKARPAFIVSKKLNL